MDRERNRGQTSEITLAAAAVQRSIAVQDFLPGAFQGNAHAIVLSDDRSEITDKKNLILGALPAS